ncbi:MAG: Bax inhibitor-1/YccA family protein [Solobacterium sp.]|nr:Bax inhibitor-1/YccA family protein [Solobacterium sp.]
MSEFNRAETVVNEAGGLRSYVAGVFTKMGIAVLITALVAFAGYLSLVSGGFMMNMYLNGTISIAYIIVAVAQLVLCIILSRKITTLETGKAAALFYGYAALTGVTFSVLPLAFDIPTIFMAFAFAAVMFFSCAVIGHTTSVDLTKFSGLMVGALIALVIATIASLFIPALRDSLIISYIGVILFLFLTAWDMQKIKGYYYGTQGGYGTIGANLAIFGAFQLYLDFINLFLYVLRILGSRSSRK